MVFFGSSEEARNYSCRISIENKYGNEFIYSGPVHTLDKTERAIINSGYILLIRPSAAKRLLDEKNRLKIVVTIQNLTNEATSMVFQDFYQTDLDRLEKFELLDSDSSLDSENEY